MSKYFGLFKSINLAIFFLSILLISFIYFIVDFSTSGFIGRCRLFLCYSCFFFSHVKCLCLVRFGFNFSRDLLRFWCLDFLLLLVLFLCFFNIRINCLFLNSFHIFLYTLLFFLYHLTPIDFKNQLNWEKDYLGSSQVFQ
jgi:hypothetical protein